MKKKAEKVFAVIFPLMVCALIITALLFAIKSAGLKSKSENETIIENGIRRAAVSCYCNEGAYPASIDYLIDNYGLNIDKNKYTVYFVSVSSNTMPEIKVIAR